MKQKIQSPEDKEYFVETLKTYFSAGIPEDINDTVNVVLESALKKCY